MSDFFRPGFPCVMCDRTDGETWINLTDRTSHRWDAIKNEWVTPEEYTARRQEANHAYWESNYAAED